MKVALLDDALDNPALNYSLKDVNLCIVCNSILLKIIPFLFLPRDAKDAEVKSLRKTAEKLREEVEHLRKQLTSEKYER